MYATTEVNLTSTRVPESRCPSCGELLDAATGDLTTGEPAEPSAGVATICAYCGALLQFGENLQLHVISEEAVQALGETELQLIAKVRQTLRERRVRR